MATQLKESGTHERAMQPFVISNNPENMAFIMFSLIPVFENKNAMPLKIKLDDKTSIKTKEKQITPPISIMDEIEEVMLSENDSDCCALLDICSSFILFS